MKKDNKGMAAKLALAAIATISLWGCSSDDENDDVATGPRPLVFQVTETPMENPEAPAATRTAETTTATFSSFSYNYYVGSTLSSPEIADRINTEGKWLWQSRSGYWPSGYNNDTPVTFYAYSNVDISENNVYKDNDGKVKLSFEVDETSSQQKDLLVASTTKSWNECKGTLSFNFSHVCGAVSLSLCKTNSLSNYTVQVKTVKLYNIPSKGDYCLADGNWEVQSNSADLKNFTVLSYDNSYMTVETAQTPLMDDGHYLFLLPQTLTAWDKSSTLANAYVEIECKIYDSNNYKVGGDGWGKVYLPLGITINQGKINPVTISMGTALRDSNGDKIFQLTERHYEASIYHS